MIVLSVHHEVFDSFEWQIRISETATVAELAQEVATRVGRSPETPVTLEVGGFKLWPKE